MVIRISLVFSLLFAACMSASAADREGNYSGRGSLTCSKFLTAQRDNSIEFAAVGGWVAGYITAYNTLAADTYDILGNSDVDGALLWIGRYCAEHPLRSMSDAMESLMEELKANRKRKRS